MPDCESLLFTVDVGTSEAVFGRTLVVVGFWLFCPAAFAQWETLKNCRLLPNPANDGDSFHVEHAGKEYLVRLYFVDAPETDDSIAERVSEQAQYFGTAPENVLRAGQEAKKVTSQLLARPFTVTTRFQDARGRSNMPRYYATIKTGSGEDLGIELVTRGLARSYGAAADVPGAVARNQYDRLESSARTKGLGAWTKHKVAVSPEPSPPRAEPAPPTPKTESGDVDFVGSILRDRTAPVLSVGSPAVEAQAESARKPEMPRTPQTTGLRISLNKGSKSQLETLPGIGPTIAARIMDNRPFTRVEDLKKIKGIGPQTYAEIESLVTP